MTYVKCFTMNVGSESKVCPLDFKKKKFMFVCCKVLQYIILACWTFLTI
jgi:hypothetical protein